MANATSYSVKAIFRAIDHITGPIMRMRGAVSAFASAADSGMKAAAKSVDGLAAHARKTATSLGAVAIGAGMATAKVAAIGMEFDHVLTGAAVRFSTPIEKGSEAFARLEAAALQTGATTQFTASAAAGVLKDLAAAGFDAEAAIGSLPRVAALAVAAEVDLTTASAMAVKSIGALGLPSETAADKVASLAYASDLLSAAADASAISFEQVFESFSKAGPIAKAAGLRMEEVAAAFAVMGVSGEEAELAGTHLKSLMAGLASGDGAETIERIGAEVVKAADGSVDLVATMGSLHKAMAGMRNDDKVAALDQIFGKVNITTGSTLVDQASKFASVTSDMLAAQGSVARKADVLGKTDLSAWRGLQSAFEAFTLALWGAIKGPVRAAIDSFGQFFSKIAATLSGSQALQAALGGGLVTTLIGLGQVVLGLVGAYVSLRAITIAIQVTHAALMLGLGLVRAAVLAYNGTLLITAAGTQGLTLYTGAMMVAAYGYATAAQVVTAAQWLWNAALMGNPLVWFGAVLAVVIGAVLYFSGALGMLGRIVRLLLAPFGMLADGVATLTGGVAQATGAIDQLHDAAGRPFPQMAIPGPIIGAPQYAPGAEPQAKDGRDYIEGIEGAAAERRARAERDAEDPSYRARARAELFGLADYDRAPVGHSPTPSGGATVSGSASVEVAVKVPGQRGAATPATVKVPLSGGFDGAP